MIHSLPAGRAARGAEESGAISAGQAGDQVELPAIPTLQSVHTFKHWIAKHKQTFLILNNYI